MSAVNDAFNALSDLSLWYQVQQGDDLSLASIPSVAQLRWTYLRDNWEQIKSNLLKYAPTSQDSATLLDQINAFSALVDSQRSMINKNNNPLRSQSVFQQYYLMFTRISISDLPLSMEEKKIIDQTKNRVRRFTKTDFEKIIDYLQVARDEGADIINGTDVDYNRIFGRSPATVLKNKNPADVVKLRYYQNGIKSAEYVITNYFNTDNGFIDPFALAKSNANNPDYDVQISTAGALVRMQYGDSLQDLAQRYLGNADRWIEIAIANGLKPPYIDEVGESIPLLSNGSGSLINIAALNPSSEPNADKFYINQIIFLQSDTIPFVDQRTILNLRTVPVSGEIVLELSGDPDLDKFKTNENAYVRVFKPNTINSQFFILIPIVGSTAPKQLNETPWFLRTKKEDEKQSGVDLAIGDDGDLQFTASGDLALSYGLANAIQAAKMKFVVEQGTLNRHDDYGITSIVGATNIDMSTNKGRLVTSIVSAIQADSRFSAVQNLSITPLTSNKGSGLLVQLVVRLAGTGTPIPISFTINPT